MPDAKPKSRRLLKWLGIAFVLLLAVAAGVGFYLWKGISGVPDFYLRERLTGADRDEAIASVERKFLAFQDSLGGAAAASSDADGSAEEPSVAVVSFTGVELDTYFDKWLTDNDYKSAFEAHLADPRLAIVDGDVVMAGKMRSFNDAVVSLRFKPDLSESDVARLLFEGAYLGSVSLPDKAMEVFYDKSSGAILARMPELIDNAAIEDGALNGAAIDLAIDRQLLRLMDREPVEDLVLFPPLLGRGTIASQVVQLKADDDGLTVGFRPLSAEEREAFLAQLKADASAGLAAAASGEDE